MDNNESTGKDRYTLALSAPQSAACIAVDLSSSENVENFASLIQRGEDGSLANGKEGFEACMHQILHTAARFDADIVKCCSRSVVAVVNLENKDKSFAIIHAVKCAQEMAGEMASERSGIKIGVGVGDFYIGHQYAGKASLGVPFGDAFNDACVAVESCKGNEVALSEAVWAIARSSFQLLHSHSNGSVVIDCKGPRKTQKVEVSWQGSCIGMGG